MNLNYTLVGEGPPLLILHGLFGSGDNWLSIAKKIAGRFSCILPDLPNHGDSPKLKDFDYPHIAEALQSFLREHFDTPMIVMGHSMGGKAAMALALENPDAVSKLIVVDMAPKTYPAGHEEILDAMRSVDLSEVSARRDADEQLARNIPNAAVRAFLLKNLRGKDSKYSWRIDLDLLKRRYSDILDWPYDSGTYENPVLFIRGEQSNYIGDEDMHTAQSFFPAAELRTVPDTGHWLHAEKTDRFLDIFSRFIDS
jgi:pimeloyl-ACP methyl ester carboxylesterase